MTPGTLASLSITARPGGLLGRARAFLTQPVVGYGTVVHEFAWLTTHRFVLQDGPQTIRVWQRRGSTATGATRLDVTVAPGETLHVDAVLGIGGFKLSVERTPAVAGHSSPEEPAE